MKIFMKIHNRAKFHFHSICGSQVINLQSFSYQQKGGFWPAFGLFFMDYNPKSSRICTKLSPVMQCKASYHVCYRFWFIIENSGKWTEKTYFGGFFKRFLGHAQPCPKGKTQIFFQMKGFKKTHNRATFDLNTICGCQVI